MGLILQYAVVGLIVLVAALYAAYVLMPRSWRFHVERHVNPLLPPRWRRYSALTSGCAGCSNSATPKQTAVPLNRITRR